MQRWTVVALVAMAAVTSGCNAYGYRYQPHPQILYSPIFADYRTQGDTVDILVDTDGLRLRTISVLQPDGRQVPPRAIDFPPFAPKLMGGTQEEIYGPDLAQGPTVAHFDSAAIGPGPWTVQVHLQAVPAETIKVGD